MLINKYDTVLHFINELLSANYPIRPTPWLSGYDW